MVKEKIKGFFEKIWIYCKTEICHPIMEQKLKGKMVTILKIP